VKRFVAIPVLALVLGVCRSQAAAAPPEPEAGARTQPAEADDAEQPWDGGYDLAATRRSDFTIGASLGLSLGSGYGTPNEADAIDNPAWVADTGVGLGSSFDVWLGGALRDWFTFGLGITGFGFEGSGKQLSGGGFIFRVEAFPFFGQAPELADVGAFASFGLGSATIEEDGDEVAEGGAVSIVRFGAFWEPWRFGGFAAGPSVEYAHVFSQSLRAYAASAGFRAAFYAGP
jgi:hypothetical protein